MSIHTMNNACAPVNVNSGACLRGNQDFELCLDIVPSFQKWDALVRSTPPEQLASIQDQKIAAILRKCRGAERAIPFMSVVDFLHAKDSLKWHNVSPRHCDFPQRSALIQERASDGVAHEWHDQYCDHVNGLRIEDMEGSLVFRSEALDDMGYLEFIGLVESLIDSDRRFVTVNALMDRRSIVGRGREVVL